MLKLCSVLAGLLVLSATPAVRAEGAPTAFFLHTATIFPFSVTDGVGLPLTLLNTASAVVPAGGDWGLIFKGGFATGFAIFQPAPQIQMGASTKISSMLRLGGTVSYRYVPHWQGTPTDAHVGAVTLGLPIPITQGLTVGLPTGVARNFTTEKWSVFTSMELNFRL